MSAKNLYKIMAILMGYGLIISGFILFGQSLEKNIRILDIVVCCVIYTQFVEFSLFPLIKLNDPANKEVGMMGLHFTALDTCCVLSIALMVCGIAYDIEFKYQLYGQLFILFLLIIGRVLTLHAGDKVVQIYEKEQQTIAGKISLRNAMDDFMDDLAAVNGLEATDKQRLQAIHEEMRFITPSTNPEALTFDSKFLDSIDELRVLLRDVDFNKDKIKVEVGKMERTLKRRKNY